ncbi:MAG TPA: 3-deoxy-D-manno-octulosonic acid transferase [Candidatus Acidoferrales bacterium]|nr:3-deoxy-D-manno-octulosonic acid transferase [Candidatus Acidoferrales bacterium]
MTCTVTASPNDAFLMYFLYRIITAVGMLVLAPYFALRGWRRGEHSGAFRERLGLLQSDVFASARGDATSEIDPVPEGAIWVHAVSVGEVLAAKPLIEGLKRRFPGRAIFVSTTTETGQRLARERLQSADAIFYFPLDWVVPVRSALRKIRPSLVIVMETEIWPNFLREARRSRIPVIFANARISEKSFSRFERWRFLIGEFFQRTLQDPELFLTQSEEDAKRLVSMGAPEERVEITGNMKYDVEPPAIGRFGAWLEAQIRQQERWPVLIAGSVVEGEEQAVLAGYDAVQRQWRRTLLILAPRKPDRFNAAEKLIAEGGWNTVRRSQLNLSDPLDESADVLVLDSIGELAGLYSLADAVFVGGSLVPLGGHNILEPACFSRPPVFGPSMENFREMAERFLDAHAGIQVANGEQLGRVWVQLIENNAMRERMGKAAREISEQNRGATARSLERIAAVMAQSDGDSSGDGTDGMKAVEGNKKGSAA